jgi:hypothetical protein
MIARSVTSIARIRVSLFAPAAVLTPSLQHGVAVFQYSLANPPQLGSDEASVLGKARWIKPELAV